MDMTIGNTQLQLRGVVATNIRSHFIVLIRVEHQGWPVHDELKVDWKTYEHCQDQQSLNKYNIAIMFVFEVMPPEDICGEYDLCTWFDSSRVIGWIVTEQNSVVEAGIGTLFKESRQQGKCVIVEIND